MDRAPLSALSAASHVFEMRGAQVMLAAHVAEIFDVETRQIVQNIAKRSEIFTESYAFQLTHSERDHLRSSGVIPKPGRGGSRALPWVVTQKGAIRLAMIMTVPKAIEAADIFIDIFTELAHQIQAGRTEIAISRPGRLVADPEQAEQARKVRARLARTIEELLDTVIDSQANVTVRDELGDAARGMRGRLKAWINEKRVSNSKIEAETLLMLEQVRDLEERRRADLQGAALDQEAKHLANVTTKIGLVERLLKLHDQLEPNAMVQLFEEYGPAPLPPRSPIPR